MKCPNCNAVISPHAKRCEYCGEYFLENESAEAPARKSISYTFGPVYSEPCVIEYDEHGRIKRQKVEDRKVLAVYKEEVELSFPPPILLKH